MLNKKIIKYETSADDHLKNIFFIIVFLFKSKF